MKGLEFYSAAAQIIPVLMLVVAVEIRAFGPIFDRGSILTRAFEGAVLAVIVLAEFRALRVLQVERTGDLLGVRDSWLIWSAIVILGAVIVAHATGTGPRVRR